jgi:UDP-glucose 4-epimerase
MANTILVVGGAGYIGSHMTDYLQREGFNPIVLDDLSSGHRDAVLQAELIEGSILDSQLLDTVFSIHKIHAVMHFASFIQVGESVQHPAKYYLNNVAGTLNLLMAMLKHRVTKFIFSSTAAVYGEPNYTPIDEKHVISPMNPYGHSKQMVEKMLEDFSRSYDFCYATLRYFNAAGADPAGKLRERHAPETHLIPLLLQVAAGQREAITLYGQDYPTQDGSCIRDYIHVTDLCSAHLLALQQLERGVKSRAYNLGTGQGYSVLQLIDAARRVTQKPIPIVYGARRVGDPAILIADPAVAMRELNWRPHYSDLDTMIKHAWAATL